MAEAALIVTTKGYGKVVKADDFPTRNRGSKGVKCFKVTSDSGTIVAVEHVQTEVGQRVLVVTANGMSAMLPVDQIAIRSRGAGGVKVMTVADDDCVVAIVV